MLFPVPPGESTFVFRELNHESNLQNNSMTKRFAFSSSSVWRELMTISSPMAQRTGSPGLRTWKHLQESTPWLGCNLRLFWAGLPVLIFVFVDLVIALILQFRFGVDAPRRGRLYHISGRLQNST